MRVRASCVVRRGYAVFSVRGVVHAASAMQRLEALCLFANGTKWNFRVLASVRPRALKVNFNRGWVSYRGRHMEHHRRSVF